MGLEKKRLLLILVVSAALFYSTGTVLSEQKKTGNDRNGKLLYDKLKCGYCHKINGKGGNTGPDLTKEGAKNRGVEWQMKHLVDPESKHAKQPDMPKFDNLTEKMLLDLAAYIESLK